MSFLGDLAKGMLNTAYKQVNGIRTDVGRSYNEGSKLSDSELVSKFKQARKDDDFKKSMGYANAIKERGLDK